MDSGDLNLASPNRSSAKKADRREQRFAVAWHLAWSLAVVAATSALAVTGGLQRVELAALAAAVVPGLVGALLAATAGQAGQVVAILVWAAAAAAASLLTGGVVGPLAAWCLAPLAAASAFRSFCTCCWNATCALTTSGSGSPSVSSTTLNSTGPASCFSAPAMRW